MGMFYLHSYTGFSCNMTYCMELPHINCPRQCQPAWLPVNHFWSFQGLRLKLKVISGLGVAVGAIATPLHTTAYNV